ncbi:MAG: hypothetical protein CVV64_10925 [Candidatus Wallbacteria bacterium HGW-Wallbacteria-1]|jgi:hypothetical protein|uniref:Uncharacterized protein n=1 Tax=Candidatus Wallbacteria bacterium HGW-Wallbacteria-1 TaxID=2013854 RepID=A0A2N1PPH3_9BACT|nr:MAG: hypothetical protein CVV64_10925 [Candidatus Wallbacteria bacterium HGW-Wallbacteria-1]
MTGTDRFKALAMSLCRDMGFRILGDEIPLSLGLCDPSGENYTAAGSDALTASSSLNGHDLNGDESSDLSWEGDFFADSIPMETPWEHILVRPGFSTIVMVALVKADGFDRDEIEMRVQWLKALAAGVEGMTWAPDLILTESRVHVTTIGMIVFEERPTAEMVGLIRVQSELALFRGRRNLFWTIDLSRSKVHSHGFLPMVMRPRPGAIEKLLRTLE